MKYYSNRRTQGLELRKRAKNLTQGLQSESLKKVFKETNQENNKPLVLETGCGYGFFTQNIVNYCSSLYATDIEDYFPQELKENKKIRYFSGVDGARLPFKNNYFDVVFSVDVIEHVKDDLNFVKEGLRVLKKGGLLIIGTPNENRLINKICRLIGKKRIYPLCVGYDKCFGKVIHLREYTEERIKQLLERSNYKYTVGKIEYLSFGLLGIFEIRCPSYFEKYCQFLLFTIKKE